MGHHEITPRGGACHLTLTYVATCTLGPLGAGQEVAAMSIATQVTGFEEGLFGTATVTSNAYDPDPTDNSLTADVLIQHGATN